MPWKPEKGWMTPKNDNCINCERPVAWFWSPGYIVYDWETRTYRRQHVECRAEEIRRAEMERPQLPPSESPRAA